MNELIQRFAINNTGRDFVVGDIHGCFSYLEIILETLDFDTNRDRLFSVGDLVDRGPESARALEFLAHPWFHAIRGNHEMFLLETDFQDPRAVALWRANGGSWWFEQPPALKEQIRAAVVKLPYVIEVETNRGIVGIVHADVPRYFNWTAFIDEVETGTSEVLDIAVWSRLRAEGRWPHGVEGVYRVFIGHTPHWGEIFRVGNVFCIDTGAVFGLEYGIPNACLTTMELTGIETYSQPVTPASLAKR